MAEFGLIQPFDIDHGELDGIEPNQVFTMGYEFALLVEALKRPEAISRAVSCLNKDRIEKACINSGRPYKLFWMAGDTSEHWMQLEVAPL